MRKPRLYGSWAGFAAAVACCGGIGCASGTPPVAAGLPQAATVIEAESFKTSFTTFKIKGYRLEELKRGKKAPEAASIGLSAYRAGIGFVWAKAPSAFSFKLQKEGANAPRTDVACLWGVATTGAGFARKAYGSPFYVPDGSVLVCEFRLATGAEPWKLLLWTGPPAAASTPGFPAGGVLGSGDVGYEAVSTNMVEPGGKRTPSLTGTNFVREGQAVAAVDRTGPGRIVLGPSIALLDEPLFAAVGAAVLLGDWEVTVASSTPP